MVGFLIATILLTLLASAAYGFSDSKKNDENVKVIISQSIKIEGAVIHDGKNRHRPRRKFRLRE